MSDTSAAMSRRVTGTTSSTHHELVGSPLLQGLENQYTPPALRLAGIIHDTMVKRAKDILSRSRWRVATVHIPHNATDVVTLLNSRVLAGSPALQQCNNVRLDHHAFQACCVQ